MAARTGGRPPPSPRPASQSPKASDIPSFTECMCDKCAASCTYNLASAYFTQAEAIRKMLLVDVQVSHPRLQLRASSECAPRLVGFITHAGIYARCPMANVDRPCGLGGMPTPHRTQGRSRNLLLLSRRTEVPYASR